MNTLKVHLGAATEIVFVAFGVAQLDLGCEMQVRKVLSVSLLTLSR